MDIKFKKAIAREGLIFVALFGISYIVYLVVRLAKWKIHRPKEEVISPKRDFGERNPERSEG